MATSAALVSSRGSFAQEFFSLPAISTTSPTESAAGLPDSIHSNECVRVVSVGYEHVKGIIKNMEEQTGSKISESEPALLKKMADFVKTKGFSNTLEHVRCVDLLGRTFIFIGSVHGDRISGCLIKALRDCSLESGKNRTRYVLIGEGTERNPEIEKKVFPSSKCRCYGMEDDRIPLLVSLITSYVRMAEFAKDFSSFDKMSERDSEAFFWVAENFVKGFDQHSRQQGLFTQLAESVNHRRKPAYSNLLAAIKELETEGFVSLTEFSPKIWAELLKDLAKKWMEEANLNEKSSKQTTLVLNRPCAKNLNCFLEEVNRKQRDSVLAKNILTV